MTLEEAIKHAEEVAYQKDLESVFDTDNDRYAMTDKERTDCKECAEQHRQLAEWMKGYKQLLEQEPCDDCISRQAVLDEMYKRKADGDAITAGFIKSLPSVNPQEPKTWQFARWVATEIFDDLWEYNKDSFAEIACRKLTELGIVRAKGDEWELVEPKESEVNNG